jgi:hypothetical protein
MYQDFFYIIFMAHFTKVRQQVLPLLNSQATSYCFYKTQLTLIKEKGHLTH